MIKRSNEKIWKGDHGNERTRSEIERDEVVKFSR